MGLGPPQRQGPHRVDLHVGARVRLRRIFLGYSQEKLGQALGLTFQQIQKYERGINRVSASKLYELSQALDVPVAFFFEGVEDGAAPVTLRPAETLPQMLDPAEAEDPDVMGRRETILLVSRYYQLPSDAVRRELLGLLKSLTEQRG